ncbi:MAG: dTDP-glucose 4,6-dehydratase [Oscillospiraceae bacterium]
MTVLVTGGAGFIGSHFIDMHLERCPEDTAVCLDKLTYAGDMDNLSEAAESPRFSFVTGDICDRELLQRVFREYRPDTVVNFAAESHVDRSIASPQVFLETNYMGTAALLDASLEFGVKRFHQISTDEVYGDLPLESEEKFTEETPLAPHSPYSASKAAADMLALAYHRTYGLNVTVSRCSNNYGERQFPEKLVPLAVKKAVNGEKIPLYGDGRNVRDWIYVKDHCKAVEMILENGRAGDIYNIGADNELSNLAIAQKLLEALGKTNADIEFVADRKGHDRRYAVSSEKLRRELNFKAETDFEKKLPEVVKWFERKFGCFNA